MSLAGENGSGKSTLIKILAGVEEPDAAQHHRRGRRRFARLTPRQSAAAGIMVIFQDFSLFPNLTVAENIAFSAELHARAAAGRPPAGAGARGADAGAGRASTIPLGARVETLSVAHKQLVAICRALASDARLIIMDEPTTALTEREVRVLLEIIRRLKADGVAVLFVSHKLAEVLEVCEHVVVLRNGRKVAEGPADEFDAASLTRHMTGRDVAETPPTPLARGRAAAARGAGPRQGRRFHDIGFDLHGGEVLGVSGLLGSGRTALAKALFGLVTPDAGSVTVDGRAVPLGDPLGAAAAGIGYVPEDRLTEGLFLTQSILRNVGIGRLEAHAQGPLLDLRGALGRGGGVAAAPRGEGARPGRAGALALGRQPAAGGAGALAGARAAGAGAERADRRASTSARRPRSTASSATSPARGLGVLVISDDLPELLATCHRILVMKEGRITDDLPGPRHQRGRPRAPARVMRLDLTRNETLVAAVIVAFCARRGASSIRASCRCRR